VYNLQGSNETAENKKINMNPQDSRISISPDIQYLVSLTVEIQGAK
jgi:hypothetical protein